MPNAAKPAITGLDGLNPADPGDSARLLGMIVALAGEVFVEFAALVRADIEPWGPIVKASGVTAEE